VSAKDNHLTVAKQLRKTSASMRKSASAMRDLWEEEAALHASELERAADIVNDWIENLTDV
jgi:hypothetical protein